MDERINKLLITGLAYKKHFIRDKRSKSQKKILIVAAGVLGDGIVFLDALIHLVEYYNISKNMGVILVCRKNMKLFYENNTKEKEIEVIGVNIEEKWPTFDSFVTTIKYLNNFFIEEIYVVMHHAWGHMLAYCIRCKENYFLCYRDWYVGRKLCLKYIIRTNYKYIMHAKDDMFIGNAYRELVKNTIGINYNTRHPRIMINEGYTNPINNYVVVAPMANVTDRHFSKEQIKCIVTYLLENSTLNIYITGVSKDYNYVKDALNGINDERVINYCGKSSFDSFILLVSKAKFLIGTDSGHIHLAASLGTPSICLVGWWHLGQFLPYDYDVYFDYYPCCIYSDNVYECRNCQAKYGKAGNGRNNPRCKARIKRSESNLCIYELNVEKAYPVIAEYISRYRNDD